MFSGHAHLLKYIHDETFIKYKRRFIIETLFCASHLNSPLQPCPWSMFEHAFLFQQINTSWNLEHGIVGIVENNSENMVRISLFAWKNIWPVFQTSFSVFLTNNCRSAAEAINALLIIWFLHHGNVIRSIINIWLVLYFNIYNSCRGYKSSLLSWKKQGEIGYIVGNFCRWIESLFIFLLFPCRCLRHWGCANQSICL